jgi:uncharacterized membrane protein (Fun14 family)
MADLNLTGLGIQMGGSALIGAIIGFAAKKVAKIIAVIIGVQLAVFKFLETRGILVVDWDRLTGGLVDLGNASGEATSYLFSIVSTAGVGAGFVGGFLVGFKKA